jgi:hypothetical protein
MSQRNLVRNFVRYVAAPALVLGLGASSINCKNALDAAQGCDEFDPAHASFAGSVSFGLDAKLEANVKTFLDASGRFEVLGEAMVTDVAKACENIAVAAGQDKAMWDSKTGSERAQAACDAASAGVTAAFNAAGSVQLSLSISGGHCEASVDAQASCNAKCDLSGKCTPGELTASCETGHLAGSCTGSCMGSCEATGGSVDCSGECTATCTGTCMGTCSAKDAMGNCTGKCSGTCAGKCDGNCSAVAPSATCMGTCEGTCSVDFQAPHCEGKFDPPMCMLDADCSANCDASVQAQASCTPPTVKYEVVGQADAKLQAVIDALQTELPVLLLNAETRGKAAIDTVKAIGTAGVSLQGAVTGSGKALVCMAKAVEASVAAAANVNVSVSASVSVSGSASAGK